MAFLYPVEERVVKVVVGMHIQVGVVGGVGLNVVVSDANVDGQKHTGGGGGAWSNRPSGVTGGKGGSGIVLVKTTTGTVKNIPKVTGISFTSSNIVFTVQQDSGTSITHVKYTINGGSEVTTPVGTLSVAHSLSHWPHLYLSSHGRSIRMVTN